MRRLHLTLLITFCAAILWSYADLYAGQHHEIGSTIGTSNKTNVEPPKPSKYVQLASMPLKDVPAAVAPPVSAPVSSNSAKMQIYMGESGNDPARVNSIGCYGLGQDCNGVLVNSCPNWRTDYACQDIFWEGYMKRRYGSWEAAWAFWQRTDARPFPGHWW